MLRKPAKIRNSDLKIKKNNNLDDKEVTASVLTPLESFSATELALKNLSDFKIIELQSFLIKSPN